MKNFSFSNIQNHDAILNDYLSGSIELNSNLITSLLIDSCFYPASYVDTTPIQFFKNINSFVYSDYAIKKNNIENKLKNQFFGCTLLQSKFLNPNDLNLRISINSILEFKKDEFNQCRNNLLNEIIEKLDFFIHWSIWKLESRTFSLLYISWESTDCYKKIYIDKNITPKVISIIQPGHTMGGNWTNFFSPEFEFYKQLEKSKLPDFLLFGWYKNMPYTSPPNEYITINIDEIITEDFPKENFHVAYLHKLNKTNFYRVERKKYKNKNEIKIKERFTSYKEWWKVYIKRRIKGKKPPDIKLGITREQDLKRQEFDKKLNNKKLPLKIMKALDRSDKFAIQTLISKDVDLTKPISKKIKINLLQYSKLINKENLLK